jgi:Rrf2 family iron-sulfur cluster assembly transcriptional regulator
MVDLALHSGNGPVQCQEIAARQELSEGYLHRLFLKLRQAGLIDSIKGPGGGYVLARDTTEIRASDVLEAVEEILDPVFCVDENLEQGCERAEGCPTHWLWERLAGAIRGVLDSVTLAELCERSGASQGLF